ncbi:hypothetical protein C8Q76DRAFT_713777, partial [Earliella scabrosa]
MTTPVIQFYMTTLGLPRNGTAVQVLSPIVPLRRFPVQSILPHYVGGEPSLLAIAAHPYGHRPALGGEYLLSSTAVGPRGTFRLSRDSCVLSEHLPRILEDKHALLHLREAWIVDVSPSTVLLNPLRVLDWISAALASLPALETVVVVFDHVRYSGARMNMRLLPALSDAAVPPGKLKTLRLVHGYSSKPFPEPRIRKVPLEKMLTQLASHEYDYFETFILQTTSHFVVDEDDLEELRRRFPVVRHECINALSAVPVPDYCVEPAAYSSPMFPGSLW